MNARPRVVVIGAGAAGTAACYAAHAAGAEVVLFDGGPGATSLSTGAVDATPWEQRAAAAATLGLALVAEPLPAEVEAFVTALGCWQLVPAGGPPAWLATESGRLRSARGHDRALLSLAGLPHGARVVLPRVERAEWDADALARALAADPAARALGVALGAADADLLRLHGEERIPAADLAARHDDPERLAFLGARLERVVADERRRDRRVDALLLGPWLGSREARARELGERLGLCVGEVLGTLGGAPGLRLEAARARLLGPRVDLVPARVRSVARVDGELVVRPAASSRAGAGAPTRADAVVLATGGLAGGGIRYVAAEQDAPRGAPARARVPFALSLEAPVRLGVHGEDLDITSSTLGPSLDEVGWPTSAAPSLLESVGLRAGPHRELAPGIFGAGDALADRPRTLLGAVATGLEAGRAAAERRD
ncbi:MAG: FAD-binding protein [Polyangiaceae bacterium]|nr:FAD-binding protein [Polyangiaceae bacterium]